MFHANEAIVSRAKKRSESTAKGRASVEREREQPFTYDESTKMVTIRGTFDAPDPAEKWKLTLFGNGIGIWPEMSIPHFEFTGPTFTITFLTYDRPTSFRATVSSAQLSDWSTSEFSEPIWSAATPASGEGATSPIGTGQTRPAGEN